MTDIPALKAKYQELWATTEIIPSKIHEVHVVCNRLLDPKAVVSYLAIESATKVPWWVIAVIHEREGSGEWWRNIAQGDPWNRISTHIPRGRGPFKSFQDAAVDALTKCPPFAGKWGDWSAGGTLVLLEMYNGFGYENIHHEASPYIWAATNHEEWGKYVSDGHYDPRVWDQQLGCAAMLKHMKQLNAEVKI